MSGPYCRTCIYFHALPFQDDRGECTDREKVIWDRNGNTARSSPEVFSTYSCANHKTDKDKLTGGE